MMNDMILRLDAIGVVDKYDFNFPQYMERFATELRDAMKEDIKKEIEEIQSIQPDRKIGQWIFTGYDMDGVFYGMCSECGRGVRHVAWKYCPNCGAYMGEEDE